MIGGKIQSVRERPTTMSVVLCALLCWLLAMVQVGFFNRLPIFGATIELVLAAVCYIGWRRGALTGAVAGTVGGFILDALTATGVSLLPIIFAVAGIYMAMAAERLFDHPFTYGLTLLPVYALMGGYRALWCGQFMRVFAVMAGGYLVSLVIYVPSAIRFFRGRR